MSYQESGFDLSAFRPLLFVFFAVVLARFIVIIKSRDYPIKAQNFRLRERNCIYGFFTLLIKFLVPNKLITNYIDAVYRLRLMSGLFLQVPDKSILTSV
jgi:hypothetical protein